MSVPLHLSDPLAQGLNTFVTTQDNGTMWDMVTFRKYSVTPSDYQKTVIPLLVDYEHRKPKSYHGLVPAPPANGLQHLYMDIDFSVRLLPEHQEAINAAHAKRRLFDGIGNLSELKAYNDIVVPMAIQMSLEYKIDYESMTPFYRLVEKTVEVALKADGLPLYETHTSPKFALKGGKTDPHWVIKCGIHLHARFNVTKVRIQLQCCF
jgi:hypothetical protein